MFDAQGWSARLSGSGGAGSLPLLTLPVAPLWVLWGSCGSTRRGERLPWAGEGRREERRLVGRHRPEGRQEEAGGDQLLSITPHLCSAGSSASPSTTPTFPTSAAGLARSCSGGPGASPSSSTSSPRSRITLPVNSKRSVPQLSGNDAAQLPGGRGQDATASLSRGPCSFPVPVPVLREGRTAPQQGWGNFNQRTWQGDPSLRDR